MLFSSSAIAWEGAGGISLSFAGIDTKVTDDIDNNGGTPDTTKDIMHKISGNKFLDYNNDDYYNHNIEKCPDLKNNKYLTK